LPGNQWTRGRRYGQTWTREIEAAAIVGSPQKTLLYIAEAQFKHFDGLVRAGVHEAVTWDGYPPFSAHRCVRFLERVAWARREQDGAQRRRSLSHPPAASI